MKSDFTHNLVNKAVVALVFAATALSVDASQIPTDLSLDASRRASSSSVVAAASAGPEAFNIPGGLNGLGKDMYLSIVERMAKREDITIQDISSFITTSKRMSKIPLELKEKTQVISLITDKVYEAMLERQDSESKKGKMTKNPKLFLKFCKYWLKTADGRRIIKEVCEDRKTAKDAYNDFRTFIEVQKERAMRPLENFWIFREEVSRSGFHFIVRWFSLSTEKPIENPIDLCKEQFDVWLEEDDAAFESVMRGTMTNEEFLGYLENFKTVLTTIGESLRVPNDRCCSVWLVCGGSPSTPTPKLARFWFEFFFKKIGKSVYDFVKEEQTVYNSFIHLAAEYSQIEALKYCLDNKVDINKQVEDYELSLSGITPLMVAALRGQSEAVDFLLRHGANPYIKDARGRTALDFASQLRDAETSDEIVRILTKWMAAHPKRQ